MPVVIQAYRVETEWYAHGDLNGGGGFFGVMLFLYIGFLIFALVTAEYVARRREAARAAKLGPPTGLGK